MNDVIRWTYLPNFNEKFSELLIHKSRRNKIRRKLDKEEILKGIEKYVSEIRSLNEENLVMGYCLDNFSGDLKSWKIYSLSVLIFPLYGAEAEYSINLSKQGTGITTGDPLAIGRSIIPGYFSGRGDITYFLFRNNPFDNPEMYRDDFF